ncbi:MAG: transporter substrate-binding domain-containing protein [Acidovorax sp.]|nr:MAG: transporter substrate-binding domain-containing protein [Acidovorax sp.]
MTLHSLSRRSLVALASACALSCAWTVASAATAFDFSPEQKGRIRAEKDAAAIQAIPKSFKFVKEGVFTVAIAPFAPPIATYASDAKTVVGFDPDYAQLIADALGGFYVRADSKITSIKEPKDIAGLKVITGSGTNQERILLEWNKQNIAAGLKPIEPVYFDDDAARILGVISGRADANFNPNAPQAYQAAKDGKIKIVGTVNAGWPLKSDVAITTRKGSGLADALTLATNGLIKNGKYTQALQRWSLLEEALPKSETNPPGLPKF